MKSIAFTAVFFVLGFAISQTHGNEWTGAGADDLWANPDNWSQGVVPLNSTSHPAFGWDDPNGPFYPLTPDTMVLCGTTTRCLRLKTLQFLSMILSQPRLMESGLAWTAPRIRWR
jgi:hypothetical protein